MQFLKPKVFTVFDHSFPNDTATIVVAVSGGADSLALTLLAKEYADEKSLVLEAVTVDHKLRPESTAEAKQVFEILTNRGITHHTLTWEHDEHINRRHERAREARYCFLIEFCKNYPNPALLTAHHQQDQIETILMRFLKGSGPAGFRGIQAVRNEENIPIIRPLLEISPLDLRSYLNDKDITWIEDPSNADSHYERTRVRQLVDQIKGLGWKDQGILESAAKIYRLHETLENITTGYAQDFVISDDPLTLNQTAFFTIPHQIQKQYLRQAIWKIGGADYPKPYPTIEAVLEMLKQPKVNGYKIAGCMIDVAKKSICLSQSS